MDANVKKLILSNLDTILDKSKLEPLDRWFINDDGEFINVQIETYLDNKVFHAAPDNKPMEADQLKRGDIPLMSFIERYCGSLECVTKNHKTDHYNPENKVQVITKSGQFVFSYDLQQGQSSYQDIGCYTDLFGDEVNIIDCHLSGTRKDNFSLYSGNGFNILFSDEVISITYLFGCFDPLRKQSLYSIHNIEKPKNITIETYGLQYIDDIKDGDPTWMKNKDMVTFDLTVFNDQKNKDFTKGFVALPFMMSSNGIIVQSEMFMPMRKTEIKDDQTRVVSNYLYRL